MGHRVLGVSPNGFAVPAGIRCHWTRRNGWHRFARGFGEMPVICITRLNGGQVYVNAEHIQALEAMPDTHIQLTNGQSYIAREPVPELVERIIAYQRRVRGTDRHLVPVPNGVDS
jgi:flagellar protein FlbD